MLCIRYETDLSLNIKLYLAHLVIHVYRKIFSQIIVIELNRHNSWICWYEYVDQIKLRVSRSLLIDQQIISDYEVEDASSLWVPSTYASIYCGHNSLKFNESVWQLAICSTFSTLVLLWARFRKLRDKAYFEDYNYFWRMMVTTSRWLMTNVWMMLRRSGYLNLYYPYNGIRFRIKTRTKTWEMCSRLNSGVAMSHESLSVNVNRAVSGGSALLAHSFGAYSSAIGFTLALTPHMSWHLNVLHSGLPEHFL